jgi:hypothetical protein
MNPNCPDCKGTGWIVLLTSRKRCHCDREPFDWSKPIKPGDWYPTADDFGEVVRAINARLAAAGQYQVLRVVGFTASTYTWGASTPRTHK